MDEPSRLYGPSHRWSRHDPKFIPWFAIEKYGEELARAIMEDHVILDREESRHIEATLPKSSGMRFLEIVANIGFIIVLLPLLVLILIICVIILWVMW